jgi:hypothetical protein
MGIEFVARSVLMPSPGSCFLAAPLLVGLTEWRRPLAEDDDELFLGGRLFGVHT